MKAIALKAIALKEWLMNVPDGAIIEMKDGYADWEQRFKLRATYPLLVAEEEVEAKEEA